MNILKITTFPIILVTNIKILKTLRRLMLITINIAFFVMIGKSPHLRADLECFRDVSLFIEYKN